MSQDRC